jgi:hypothetical protein
LLVSDHDGLLSLLNHHMPFRFQTCFDLFDSTRIFGVEFSPRLERPPVRRDAALAQPRGFIGGMGGDPGEDAGRDRAGNGGAMLFGQGGANVVDRRQLPISTSAFFALVACVVPG